MRVAVTLVHDPASSHADVRAALEELCGVVYAVRPRAYAAVLPGLGRAEALGVLAKVEARCGARGIAIEAAHGETAVELFVRLVAGGRPPREADHR